MSVVKTSLNVHVGLFRVPTVREKSGENEFFSRSGQSQGNLKLVREI